MDSLEEGGECHERCQNVCLLPEAILLLPWQESVAKVTHHRMCARSKLPERDALSASSSGRFLFQPITALPSALPLPAIVALLLRGGSSIFALIVDIGSKAGGDRRFTSQMGSRKILWVEGQHGPAQQKSGDCTSSQERVSNSLALVPWEMQALGLGWGVSPTPRTLATPSDHREEW